ncbi:alpha/beta hydrolase [Nocardia transvalensis]|uniref:alpha/beta hydrolase n=1 Tax=Nocardia transvalensis TaxID=37333 RepID=UPI001893DA54|nr:alpha/beta hydrolase [Nocardia transvalensis]MBF6327986.1 alpha/beta fold hydrolase [Nocardia transvalensis]
MALPNARKLAAVCAALAFTLGACGLVPGRQPADFYPAELARYYTQQVRWGSCDDMIPPGESVSAVTRCARIDVPLDYDLPNGRMIQLALSHKPATGERIGSVLFNPGGPGEPGLTTVEQADSPALAERFDRVGFDPRGVGASTPRISCGEPGDGIIEIGPDDDLSAAREHYRRMRAERCAQISGTDLLAHVGTRETVRDMDIIRAVLGERTLTYVGYSYGTRLGWAYAERYPHRVRALVLDGAVLPDEDAYTRQLRQAKGFQDAFDSLAAECARRTDCPLGQDPAQAVARYRELVLPLIDHPLTSPRTGRTLYYDDTIERTDHALYSPTRWDPLIGALEALRTGDPDPMLELPLGNGSAPDPAAPTDDALVAITCVDYPPLTDRARNDRLDAEIRAAVPYADDGRSTGRAPLSTCAFWPVPPTSAPHRLAIEDLPTVVVVSTTHDPATPHEAGVELAAQLRAKLITYEGTRHTITLHGISPCVDDQVLAYLTDLTLPSRDRPC